MNVKYHFVVAVIMSIMIFFLFKDLTISIFFFLSSFFIDVDHILDYWIHRKMFKLSFKDFMKMCKEYKVIKVVILFHSYELIVIFLLILLFWYNKLFVGIIIGMTTHILIDVLSNPILLRSYSFIFRFFHKFNHTKIYKL